MQLKNAVAMVTGGGSGLGEATVRRLAAGGAKVVILDLKGQEVADSIGDAARFVATDVTDEAQVQAAVDAARELGDLRIAVNCAGVADAARTIGKENKPFPLATFQKVVTINLIGTFNVIRLAAAAMVEHTPLDGEERGVIVNTASVAAFEGQIGQAAYSASKGGVVGMTLPVARDLAQHRIRVCTIAPGLFYTPMFQTLPQESIDSLGKQVPNPSRLGNPDEYAQLAEHIVSNPMLNGETIRLDGAIRMGPR